MPKSRTPEERRLDQLVFRWLTPTWRYPRLRGVKAFVMPRPRQRWFQWRLYRAGRRIPAADAIVLLESGTRTGMVATWLVAAGRREDLRSAIERGFVGEMPYGLGWDYCRTLACLGTDEDARILVTYLDRALALPPDESDSDPLQPGALSALEYLDEKLGTEYAQRFTAPGGPWERWPGSEGEPWTSNLERVRAEVAFACGQDPGYRRQMKLERAEAKRNRRS